MKKKTKAVRIISIALSCAALLSVASILFLVIYSKFNINYEADSLLFKTAARKESTVFYADSAPLDDEYIPVEIERAGALKKMFYSKEEISDLLIDGFIAVEDRNFYSHKGVDYKRTFAAALNFLFKKDKPFGASTITQQVVKNISGDNQTTIRRKLSEILRARRIEKEHSKDEIMEVYLNVIPMSENIYGVGLASLSYFGKEPSDLSAHEAATLIGITNAPTAYNPYTNKDACIKKRNTVLSVMRSHGIISSEVYEQSIKEPLVLIPREDQPDRYDSWFVETAIDDISADLSKKYSMSQDAARMTLLGGGYKIYTTMNPSLQRSMEEYFENESNLPSEIKNGLNYAMVVTDRESGSIAGIIGRAGKKNGNRLLNHATVNHTPASALKPIALYAPLIDEKKINWATVFDDVPLEFYQNGDTVTEYPHNSPDVYSGLVTVKDALRLSKNTVAIRLCNMRRAVNVFKSLREDFGFNTLIESEKTDSGKSLTDIAISPMALGQLTRGVSLRKLTEAFGVFSADGVLREAKTYIRVCDMNGKDILTAESHPKRIFKKETARIMNQLLMQVTDSGTASRLTIKNLVNTAGKTGTSSGSREKIFVGYTPYYTAGIWCGYDKCDRSVAAVSPSHLDIWNDIMLAAHSDILAESGTPKTFSTHGLVHRPYCMDSGGLYSEACRYDPRGSRMEYGYFTADNAPRNICDRHIVCLYDSVSKGIADPTCPKENIVRTALLHIEDRAFPKEINISDAEYVYKYISSATQTPSDPRLPYFYYALPVGEFVGVSGEKKQFNSAGKKY